MKIKQLKDVNCCHKNYFPVTLEDDLDLCQENFIIQQAICLSLLQCPNTAGCFHPSYWNIVSDPLIFHNMLYFFISVCFLCHVILIKSEVAVIGRHSSTIYTISISAVMYNSCIGQQDWLGCCIIILLKTAGILTK